MLENKIWFCHVGVLLTIFLVSCDDKSSPKASQDSGVEKSQDVGVDMLDRSDVYFYSATELSRMIRDGEITSVELLERFLERIKRYDGEINAVVAMDVEGARARAEQADDALARGEMWGPLHGVPITIKDNYEVVGMPTTAGDIDLKDYMSTQNAVSVQRLIDAGAIVFGKTNLPNGGMDWQTYNDVYGTTNNPWDLSLTPGGSSGGAAAALAAGFTALELGNDIGGSLRVPSHFCGIYGLKTTLGIIPRQGVMPGLPSTTPAVIEKNVPVFVVGPLARSAEDLDLALEVLTTPSKSEENQETVELLPPRQKDFKNYRVAVWLTDPTAITVIDDEVMSALRDLVDKLRKAGLTLDEDAHPNIDRLDDIYIWSATVTQMSTRQSLQTNDLATKRDEHRAI